MDMEVGRWLRKYAPQIKPIVVMNKSEAFDDNSSSLFAVTMEARKLGFGEPIAISAETGLGMAELYQSLRPLLENHMSQERKGDFFGGVFLHVFLSKSSEVSRTCM